MYQSKLKEIDQAFIEVNKNRPLSSEILEQLKNYYRIGLTYSSNALEGNSLTESETKIVIEDGITIGGKPLKDHMEVKGHSEAYSFLYDLVKEPGIKEEDILQLHQLLYRYVDAERAGKYRDKQVIITGTDFIPPPAKKIPDLMQSFIKSLCKLKEQYHPVEYAAKVHLELVTIHPFIDGNGRAARLLMNLALLQAGYVITIIPPVVRNDYIYAIKQAQVKPNDEKPFLNFISAMAYEAMKDYIRLIEALKA